MHRRLAAAGVGAGIGIIGIIGHIGHTGSMPKCDARVSRAYVPASPPSPSPIAVPYNMSSRPRRLVAGYANIPKLAQLQQGKVGHDVAMVGGTTLAVADGVGGWVKHGVDPRKAAATCISAVMTRLGRAKAGLDNPAAPAGTSPTSPATTQVEVVTPVVESILRQEDFADKGTTTLAVVSLDPSSARASCLCIGDSILQVYRRSGPGGGGSGSAPCWQLVHEVVDPASRRRYNYPQQIGQKAATFDAAEEKLKVWPGDLFVLASDGVGDNLSPRDIAAVLDGVACFALTDTAMQGVALELAAAAFKRSMACDPELEPTPFEMHRRAFGRKPKTNGCGKPDDICVAVGMVYV